MPRKTKYFQYYKYNEQLYFVVFNNLFLVSDFDNGELMSFFSLSITINACLYKNGVGFDAVLV